MGPCQIIEHIKSVQSKRGQHQNPMVEDHRTTVWLMVAVHHEEKETEPSRAHPTPTIKKGWLNPLYPRQTPLMGLGPFAKGPKTNRLTA